MYLCLGLGSHGWQETCLSDVDYYLLDLDCLVCFDWQGLWQLFRCEVHFWSWFGGLRSNRAVNCRRSVPRSSTFITSWIRTLGRADLELGPPKRQANCFPQCHVPWASQLVPHHQRLCGRQVWMAYELLDHDGLHSCCAALHFFRCPRNDLQSTCDLRDGHQLWGEFAHHTRYAHGR